MVGCLTSFSVVERDPIVSLLKFLSVSTEAAEATLLLSSTLVKGSMSTGCIGACHDREKKKKSEPWMITPRTPGDTTHFLRNLQCM